MQQFCHTFLRFKSSFEIIFSNLLKFFNFIKHVKLLLLVKFEEDIMKLLQAEIKNSVMK